MKVGIIGSANGIHESRFLRAFRERGIDSVFVSFDELSQSSPDGDLPDGLNGIDFLFGGPLHQGLHLAPWFETLPYVAASYAFDILYEASRDSAAASSVRRLLGSCRGLLVDCEAAARVAKEFFGYSGPTLIRAWGLECSKPPGLPSLESGREAGNDVNSKISIVSVRNFTELHGVMDVIRAFAYAAHRNKKLRLILAGDGPLRNDICELIDNLRLRNSVTILGSIPEAEVIGVIEKASVYVSASVVDGTSISLLQALQAGVPVILSNVGGNPEWVTRAEGAELFDYGDWQQLGELMLRESALGGARRFDRGELLSQHADWKRNANDIVNFSLEVIRRQADKNRYRTIRNQ